ncbi:uncharacterized protein C8Q71DRAFT_400640 [Rhodofomes roseus]|uniref:Uncharacterized protein n=1 Tax=Rhodofomes roseus TaxID=34475 RepID=A0ABQ8JZQ0_9APHY|nr:uncharacterized protein C8Q71DRAFT_400640 [Rhodofomes roseus]KAH9829552.1 hypothetical protein C8Q71DRAFT_400640 [Rhodofomes roseus]
MHRFARHAPFYPTPSWPSTTLFCVPSSLPSTFFATPGHAQPSYVVPPSSPMRLHAPDRSLCAILPDARNAACAPLLLTSFAAHRLPHITTPRAAVVRRANDLPDTNLCIQPLAMRRSLGRAQGRPQSSAAYDFLRRPLPFSTRRSICHVDPVVLCVPLILWVNRQPVPALHHAQQRRCANSTYMCPRPPDALDALTRMHMARHREVMHQRRPLHHSHGAETTTNLTMLRGARTLDSARFGRRSCKQDVQALD